MRLTRHGDYAVRVVVDLASRPAGALVPGPRGGRLPPPSRVGHQPPGRDRGRRGPPRAQPLRRRRRRVPARPRVPGASRLGPAAAPARARARGGHRGLALWIDFKGARVWAKVKIESPASDVHIRVTGKQFNWVVTYPGPDGRFDTADAKTFLAEMHVPAGSARGPGKSRSGSRPRPRT